MVPDLDVIGFAFGIRYGDLLGHRGLSHSIAFAVCLALIATFGAVSRDARWKERIIVYFYLFLATASHGVLDALTNGGLGIAFFSPFDPTRYFFEFQPIKVSPIGAHFFSGQGVEVIRSELAWVWVPSFAVIIVAIGLRGLITRSQ